MPENSGHTITVRVYRYDPTIGGKGRYDRFELDIEDQNLTTVLDVLLKIQKEQDPSLAFRYACRVSMCGSCAMVIDGKERLACKTVVGELTAAILTIRPLNHFPIVKDLVVDMAPFFEKYRQALPFFEPAVESDTPAVIPPDAKERVDIGLATECIACGCCVSSCSMVHQHQDYAGPAALSRAFTLLADSRDGLHAQRMQRVLPSCYNCRTEFNCTEVCPKEISPTRAIKYIQRQACMRALRPQSAAPPAPQKELVPSASPGITVQDSRRKFLKQVTCALGAATAAVVGGVALTATVAPALRKSERQWVLAGQMSELDPENVSNVHLQYDIQDGFYRSRKTLAVMIARAPESQEPVVYSSRCTHLGCTVRWDEAKKLFFCACHGGVFNPDGSVKSGPPPRSLDRLPHVVRGGALFVEVA